MRATAPDGAPVARIRVALARPSQHRVRASRNLIFVEVDRNAETAASRVPPMLLKAPAAQPVAHTQEVAATAPKTTNAPATRLTAVRSLALPGGTAIALSGNGRLVASRVEAVSDMPARVLLDFEGVADGLGALDHGHQPG